MPPARTDVWSTSIPCRDDKHGECWRRASFGGLSIACICDCHGSRRGKEGQ